MVEPKERAADPYRRNEGLLIKTTSEQEEQCKVRSGTNIPCLRPAMVKVRGISFCKPCAREQEAYFAIGELTEASSQRLDNEEWLVDKMGWKRQIRRGRHPAGNHEPNAA